MHLNNELDCEALKAEELQAKQKEVKEHLLDMKVENRTQQELLERIQDLEGFNDEYKKQIKALKEHDHKYKHRGEEEASILRKEIMNLKERLSK